MNVICSTYVDAAEYVLRALRTRQYSPNLNHIVIVPDKFTLAAERFYMDGLMKNGSFDVSVMTLDRLMHRIAPQGKYITAHAAAMVVRRITKECAADGELQCFRGTMMKGGFAEEMYKTITQLKSCRVGTGSRSGDCRLTNAGGDGRVMRKLHDIDLIYRKYNEFLDKTGLKDASDRMEILIDSLDCEFVNNSYFYILGFDSITPQASAAFEGLDRHSKGVINAIVDVRSVEVATGNGVVEANTADSFHAHIKTNYLKYPFIAYDKQAPITVHKALDRQDMLEAAALKIKNCLANGWEYEDIAVIGKVSLADMEVFDAAGIEYNFDHKEPLYMHPAARLITDIIEAVVSNYHGGIADIAKNPLSGVDYFSAQVFENYCIKYNMTYRIDMPFVTATLKDKDMLKVAETVRSKLYGIIRVVENELSQCQFMEQYLTAVNNLINSLKLEEKCENYAQERGEDYRPFAEQAYSKITAVLKDAEVLNDYKVGKQEFVDLLKTGLGAVEISAVPHKLKSVDIGELSAYRFGRYKLIIYLDASERLLPTVNKDGGILLDSELDRMGDTGRRIIPKIRDINIREKALTVLSMFLGEELMFLYPSEAGGEQVKEAYLLTRLREVFPQHNYIQYTYERKAYSSVSGLWREGYIKGVPSEAAGARRFFAEYNRAKNSFVKTVSEPIAALRQAFLGGEELDLSRECVQVDRAAELFFYNGVSSVSRFETFFDCPYRHYVRYGLRAKERTEGGATDAIKVGNILHDFLERYSLIAKGCDNPHAETERIFQELKSASDITDSDRSLIDRLLPEAQAIAVELTNQAERSEFLTAGTEVEFGDGKQYKGITVTASDGTQLSIEGKIDRIDELGDYVRVVDYKTGNVKKGWENIYYGRDIQLFVYMGALADSGKLPAAILYFPVSNDYRKNGAKKYMMQGYLNSDIALLCAGDKDISDKGYSDILPIRLKRDGTPDANSGKFLLSGAEFDKTLNYCKRLIGKATGEITDGFIMPTPAQGACDYCEYIGVCAPYNKAERRPIIGADKTWVTLSQEEAEGLIAALNDMDSRGSDNEAGVQND